MARAGQAGPTLTGPLFTTGAVGREQALVMRAAR